MSLNELETRLRSVAARHGLSADCLAELLGCLAEWTEEELLRTAVSEHPPGAGVDSQAMPLGAPSPGGLPDTPRYRFLDRLGKGGQAVVHLARDKVLQRALAVKALRGGSEAGPGLRARFESEAQLMAQLQHPGMVPVFDLGVMPTGEPYYTMKRIEGRTMTTVVRAVHRASQRGRWRREPGGWTFIRLVEAFHTACETVAWAHARGVVHRDLKPANIMLGEFGEVHVIDWGLAKVIDPAGGIVTRWTEDPLLATRKDTTAGTPAYMPPEQVTDLPGVGPRGDVYSLGATLYRILTDRSPYKGKDTVAVLERLLSGPPQPPAVTAAPDSPPIPAVLEAICLQAMAREPEDRFADAGQLAEAVANWLRSS